MNRREFSKQTAIAFAGLAIVPSLVFPFNTTENWNAGDVKHILPTANHSRFLIKISFEKAREKAPVLNANGKKISGTKTDIAGRFWKFDVTGLNPKTEYKLRLSESNGKAITDTWPLKTFPDPQAKTDKLRILSYTCGGGYDGPNYKDQTIFLDMTARKKLLARGMSFQPDVVIANGDQIYWDMTTVLSKSAPEFTHKEIWSKFGELDLSVPMMHEKNASIFTSICDYQIVGLYGNSLRSTPAFFISDDHDLFENDEWDKINVTLPPDSYGIKGAEQTQHMYYPEFLPDENRPTWLPGGDRMGLSPDTSMLYGTLRYGTLLEAVMYDCRRYVNYKGDHATILPQWVEDWLLKRTATEDTTHFMHIPSLPFAYSSGKLGDWYPDMLDKEEGKLVMYLEKEGWQKGWFHQHQRLIKAISDQEKRVPIIVQGDFHASSAGTIHRSGELTLKNKVHAVLTGTLGSGDLAFPSSFRKMDSTPSELIGMEETMKPIEKNGFSIIDIDEEKIVFKMFMWRPPQNIAEIDTMTPYLEYVINRK